MNKTKITMYLIFPEEAETRMYLFLLLLFALLKQDYITDITESVTQQYDVC